MILDRFNQDLSGSDEHTRRDRRFYAMKFLEFAQDRPLSEWNKALVQAFQRHLEKEGYAPGTIRKAHGIVKRVFDAAKAVHEAERIRLISEVNPNDPAAVAQILKAISLPGPMWDVGKRGTPRVEKSDMVTPAHTIEEVARMVAAAKEGKLELAEVSFLGLASVYGLRRQELARVLPADIDYSAKTMFIRTCKGGEQREQLLANELIPYFQRYGFSEHYSLSKLSELYRRVCVKAGVELRDGAGWHSFRRLLDTLLVDSFGELYAHIFLRWKLSSSSLMEERYYSRDPLEVDGEVLRGHPVLELWR
ncbi:MAG: hypothetical protein JRD89_10485 [Deltaproteobacteria bacterium]|nr:hypothetical protein [Deltaproteobacteria bacterium]